MLSILRRNLGLIAVILGTVGPVSGAWSVTNFMQPRLYPRLFVAVHFANGQLLSIDSIAHLNGVTVAWAEKGSHVDGEWFASPAPGYLRILNNMYCTTRAGMNWCYFDIREVRNVLVCTLTEFTPAWGKKIDTRPVACPDDITFFD